MNMWKNLMFPCVNTVENILHACFKPPRELCKLIALTYAYRLLCMTIKSTLKFHRTPFQEKKKNQDDFTVVHTSESLVCESKSSFGENLVPSSHLLTRSFRACDSDSGRLTESTAFANALSES